MKKIIFLLILFVVSVFFLNSQDLSNDVNVKKEKNGWDFYAEGNYSASIKALEEEKKMYPSRINIYIILGWNYKALKNFKEMERVSLEGYNINPTQKNIIRNLGEATYFQGKYYDSIKYFESYLKIAPNMDDPYIYYIYYYLGHSYLKVNSYYKAYTLLSSCNFMKSKNVQVLLLLSEVSAKINRKSEGLEYCQIALSIEPNNNEAIKLMDLLKKSN